jgi:hypothetical protein
VKLEPNNNRRFVIKNCNAGVIFRKLETNCNVRQDLHKFKEKNYFLYVNFANYKQYCFKVIIFFIGN